MPLKTLGLWSLFLLFALLAAYIIFAAIVSIWVGLSHVQQDGFWMPIVAGILSMILVLWPFFRLSRLILNSMKEKDTINI
ncbi:MAG: hypothetical protein JSW56_08375 [Deltaproteobacteria bacterium]|nr:MAG: hypothetical protein JSW56_08375 [Deltaproteobacteria bacterium]